MLIPHYLAYDGRKPRSREQPTALVRALSSPGLRTTYMNKGLATILLVIGLAVIGYGLIRKDDSQAKIDIGNTEIKLGKSDSAFNSYFIVGGIVAAIGAVLLVVKRKG